MKFRHIALLSLALGASILSGCAAKAQEQEEISLGSTKDAPSGEVRITDHDYSKDAAPVQTTTERTQQGKTFLSDGSSLESSTDGSGNKSDRRMFDSHPRVRMILLQTSVDGKQTVTVYGFGNNTVQLYDFGDKALTASADEIAQVANMTQTKTFKPVKNFMTRQKQASENLEPLPSSAFPQTPPATQPAPQMQPQQPAEPQQPSAPQIR